MGSRLSTNRYLLRVVYYPWLVLPYPVRRIVTIAGIWGLRFVSRVRGIHRLSSLTPPDKLFSLSFWGVPNISQAEYSLTVDGSVGHPLTLSLEELKSLPAVERQVTMDCVGGSRNIAQKSARIMIPSMPGPPIDV